MAAESSCLKVLRIWKQDIRMRRQRRRWSVIIFLFFLLHKGGNTCRLQVIAKEKKMQKMALIFGLFASEYFWQKMAPNPGCAWWSTWTQFSFDFVRLVEIYSCDFLKFLLSYDKSSWFDVKHSLGLDLPNLPYLIETDGRSFTETVAILT